MLNRDWALALSASTALLAGVMSCAPDNGQMYAQSDVESIDAAGAQLVAATNDGDLSEAASLYSEEAVLQPPNNPPVSGREAIAQALDRLRYSLHLDADETVTDGDLAYRTGTYSMQDRARSLEEDVQADYGEFLTVYRKQMDGRWLIVRQLFLSRAILSYGSLVVLTRPPGAEIYLVPLRVVDLTSLDLDTLNSASPYFEGITTPEGLRVRDRRETYYLVANRDTIRRRQTVLLRRADGDTLRMSLVPGP